MLEEIHAATPPQAKSAGVSGGKKRAAPGADTEDHVDPLAVAQRTPPAAAHARTPNEEITPTPTKKRRNAKPFRIEIGPPKEGEEREHVNKPNGRYNKNGVCFHKASGKWRAIVYVGKRQVNLGYFTSQEQAEGTIENARTHGLPKGFTGLRALQQPKQSNHAGVNWDKHTKKWLARVYEPSKPGGKGKEHKVGYYLDEDEAVKAIEVRRKEMGLPPSKRGRKKEVNEEPPPTRVDSTCRIRRRSGVRAVPWRSGPPAGVSWTWDRPGGPRRAWRRPCRGWVPKDGSRDWSNLAI